MTKLYTPSMLASERDNKDLGELQAEWSTFRKDIDRAADVVYHDEQIPIPTTYTLVQPGADTIPPKWINLGGAYLDKRWMDKLSSGKIVSVRNSKSTGDPEPVKIVSGGGKVWRSSTDTALTMGVTPVKIDISSYGVPLDDPKHDYLWRHYDKNAILTDIGRKIDMNWGAQWTTMFGSKPTRDMWQEETRNKYVKFYEDSDSENEDLNKGRWQDVVEAHLNYFSELITSIMRQHRDSIPVDEATAVAMHAICEFAYKISNQGEDLRSRFTTAAYSWVRNYYSLAVDTKDVISKKSIAKVQDLRTITDLLKELHSKLDDVTLQDICDASGFGERRVNSTFRLFDLHISAYREPNEEELLYTIMDELLTDRQADILERSFGLGGMTKSSLTEIAEDMGISYDTVQMDRKKAMAIMKDELNYKYGGN